MHSPGDVDDVLGQVLIAFGQGTGAMRVPRKTVTAIRARYLAMADKALPRWEEDAVQALERVRAVGRLAAHLAVVRGDTRILAADFFRAAETVERDSGTPICT